MKWHRWCGVLAIGLGLELIAGWLLHVESMVRILPSSNSVSFNTAVAFVLAGTALVAGDTARQIRWRRGVALVLMVGASLILYEDLFDVALGLDWESLHRSVADGSPRPGRVAPNTCTGLLLLATLLWNLDHAYTVRRRLLVAACCATQLLLISSGVTGLLLDPTLMFGWYKFNRMAAPTAFGLSLLTLGVYLRYRSRHAALVLSPRQQERSILATGTVLLLAMGMAGALTTFVIFANHQQQAIRDRLQGELTAQTRLAELVLADAADKTDSLLSRSLLMNLMRSVATTHTPASTTMLAETLENLLQEGFSSAELNWADGTPGIAVGQPLEAVELSLPVHQRGRGALRWSSQGFAYRISVDAREASGRLIAVLTTERRLGAFSGIYMPADSAVGSSTAHASRSAEVVICGAVGAAISCLPSRLHPTPLRLAPAGQRAHLPVDDAMAGRSEVRTGTDYRGKSVVAAYSHIGMTGLAVISKTDAVELYEPINFLLSRSAAVLAISLALGMLLLQRMLAPLVKSIVASENAAQENGKRAVESERRMTSITDNVPALIAFIDRDMIFQFANATYTRWFGIPAAAICGKATRALLDEHSYRTTLPYMQRALAGESVEFSFRTSSTVPGMPAYLALTYIPDRDQHGNVLGFNVLAFDVTAQNEHEQALAFLAYHDSLTELPNRRLFRDRLEQALVRGKRRADFTALMYLDIDHFKQINDTLGHDCGDLLLRAFSKRLALAVRGGDTVARLGGDEFTIILEGIGTESDAGVVAQKILDVMQTPFDLDGHAVRVTTSIGIAFASAERMSVDDLLQRGDEALYAAKTAGRNRYSIHQAPVVETTR